MGKISVSEAASRLGVGVARVHRRIAEGSLPAERIGSQWVIDEASLPAAMESTRPGRPLSPRSAWALVALSQPGRALGTLAPSERARAHQRWQRLMPTLDAVGELSEAQVAHTAVLLRSLLSKRAERRLYSASPRDLPDLRNDDRLVLSGVSHSHSGIASGDLVEGYVAVDDLHGVVEAYLLSTATVGRAPNVVLHIVPPVPGRVDEVAPLQLAADLAEHRRPREEARAAQLMREAARQYLHGVAAAQSASAVRNRPT